MLKIIGELLAKLLLGARRDTARAVSDPLVEKMRNLTWAPTEDDRSAQKYLAESESAGKAPLAEIMASSYLGRSGERFE